MGAYPWEKDLVKFGIVFCLGWIMFVHWPGSFCGKCINFSIKDHIFSRSRPRRRAAAIRLLCLKKYEKGLSKNKRM